jgi:hypothetical protein
VPGIQVSRCRRPLCKCLESLSEEITLRPLQLRFQFTPAQIPAASRIILSFELFQMNRYQTKGISVVAACFLVGMAAKAEQTRLAEATSPDRNYVIVIEGTTNAPKGVYFADAANGAPLGWIIRPEDAGMSNLRIETRWNASSSKVAMLVSWGTKITNLELYKKNPSGQFVPVKFEQPDVVAMFRERRNNSIFVSDSPTAPEGAIGPWKDENTIKLLTGEALVRKDNSIVHVYASFEVRIEDRGTVGNVRLYGPFDEKEAEDFIQAWPSKVD